MPAEMKRSVCPDACGLLVEVEDDRAIKVSGDPEPPYTRGFLCGKMNHYQDTVHSPRRLTEPLLRTGPNGSGEVSRLSGVGHDPLRASIKKVCVVKIHRSALQ